MPKTYNEAREEFQTNHVAIVDEYHFGTSGSVCADAGYNSPTDDPIISLFIKVPAADSQQVMYLTVDQADELVDQLLRSIKVTRQIEAAMC